MSTLSLNTSTKNIAIKYPELLKVIDVKDKQVVCDYDSTKTGEKVTSITKKIYDLAIFKSVTDGTTTTSLENLSKDKIKESILAVAKAVVEAKSKADTVDITITFNPNNGGNTASATTNMTVGDSYSFGALKSMIWTAVDPTLGGYNFVGWSKENVKVGTSATIMLDTDTINASTEFYAIFSQASKTVSTDIQFILNFENVDGTINSKTYTRSKSKPISLEYAITAQSVVTPSKSGYIFKGWALTNNATTADLLALANTYIEDTTFYPVFEVATVVG